MVTIQTVYHYGINDRLGFEFIVENELVILLLVRPSYCLDIILANED